MIRIIVTADDYGLSNGVNEAILFGINAKCITSTNVLVNMVCEQDARLLLSYDVSIGLHWNLTAGKSVAPVSAINSLVDENGFFFPYQEFKKRLKKGLIKREHIITELRHQFDRFIELFGFVPTYWNTHQNVIFIRKITKIFFFLGKELKIPFTRTFCRKYLDYNSLPLKRRFRELLVNIYIRYLFNFKYSSFARHTDYREIVFDRKNKFNIILTKSMIQKCKNGKSLEIVLHPSTKNDSIYFGTISKARIDEYQFLKNESAVFLNAINNDHSRLVSFKDFE